MNKTLVSLLVSSLVCASGAAYAADDEGDFPAKDWQKKSLHGITSITYTTVSKNTPIDKEVAAAFADVGVPTKQVAMADLRKELDLGEKDALVKVIVNNKRKEDKCWVGIAVEQKVKLSRISSITFNAESYKAGKLCSKTAIAEAVKEICAQFVQQFQDENGGKAKSKDKPKDKSKEESKDKGKSEK